MSISNFIYFIKYIFEQKKKKKKRNENVNFTKINLAYILENTDIY